MIEVHQQPEEAWSDGRQSLKPDRFKRLVCELRLIAGAVGRSLPNQNKAVSLNGQVQSHTSKVVVPA